jgi:hypothetical protein
MSIDFTKFGTANANSPDYALNDAIAEALGIPLRRRKVELRKRIDIPSVAPNRAERRERQRAVRRQLRVQR